MIDRRRTPGELREEFSVLGSTGNVGRFMLFGCLLLTNHARQVYTVVVGHQPSCNCEYLQYRRPQ